MSQDKPQSLSSLQIEYAEAQIRRTNGGHPEPMETLGALNVDIGQLAEMLLYFNDLKGKGMTAEELHRAMRGEIQFVNAIASLGIHLLDLCIFLDKDFGSIFVSAVTSIVQNADETLRPPEMPGDRS